MTWTTWWYRHVAKYHIYEIYFFCIFYLIIKTDPQLICWVVDKYKLRDYIRCTRLDFKPALIPSAGFLMWGFNTSSIYISLHIATGEILFITVGEPKRRTAFKSYNPFTPMVSIPHTVAPSSPGLSLHL